MSVASTRKFLSQPGNQFSQQAVPLGLPGSRSYTLLMGPHPSNDHGWSIKTPSIKLYFSGNSLIRARKQIRIMILVSCYSSVLS